MTRLILMAAISLALMCSCGGHIQQDEYHFPKAHDENEQIDMRVIKASDSTKLKHEQDDTSGKVYK